MPIPLRPLEKVVEKWSGRATAAAPDYSAGVAAPKKDWATYATAAKDAWRAGVTDAAGLSIHSLLILYKPSPPLSLMPTDFQFILC